MSFEESFDGPSSPTCVPENFDDWSVRPMPLDPRKKGIRAAFWDNFHGSPTVLGRLHFNACKDGCIAYTKKALPVGAAWRIRVLEITDNWERGLIIGLTSSVPEKVPDALPLVNFGQQQNFNHEIRYERTEQAGERRDTRARVNTLTRMLPLLWDTAVSKTLTLLLTTNGQLHIYLDGEYKKKLGSRLPIDGSLYGNLDLFGRCVKIKSELLLTKELETELGLPPCPKNVTLPSMKCFESTAEKIDVRISDEDVGVAPSSMGVMVKIPPEAITEHVEEVPLTMAFTTCSPNGSYIFPEGYKPLSPIYYISSNKPLTKEVEVLAEHSADITSEDEVDEMIFCIAPPPENEGENVHFIPVPAGVFEKGEEQGRLMTSQLGFFTAGTKSASTSQIRKRRAVMCCYTNEDSDTYHVAVSMSTANKVYLTNFRNSVKEMWKKSIYSLSRIPVDFAGSTSKASVVFEHHVKGWNVTSDTKKSCDFTSEMLEYDERDNVGEEDYPPRYLFTIQATNTAEQCSLSYEVKGLTRDVDFQVPLNPKRQLSSLNSEENRPTMVNLIKLGDIKIIEESMIHYSVIGRILLDDRQGNLVRAIEMDKRTTNERMTEIYRKWIRGDEYHSWETLCTCFRTCSPELEPLARKIERHFGISTLPTDDTRFPMSNTPRSPIMWLRERIFGTPDNGQSP